MISDTDGIRGTPMISVPLRQAWCTDWAVALRRWVR